jgi:lipopolysaccharide biosynthesis glycosyltransferase
MEKKDIVCCDKDPSDQGFLNYYYKDQWDKLSPIYNATRRVFSADPIKWASIEPDISVIHYTLEKPWHSTSHDKIEKLWWECYDQRTL